jgi:serine protease Do
MNTNQIIDLIKPSLIQIATQVATGTGFYLKEYDLIVTNNHVVRNVGDVTIKGKEFEKQFSKVLFTDSKYDLAFLTPPTNVEFNTIVLGDYSLMKDGDEVVAMGHPYGLNYSSTQGVISRVDRIYNGLKYIQVDAAINPGNSGGPLLNLDAEIIGINTFIIRGGDNLGFALPSTIIREALEQYMPIKGQSVVRCHACSTMVSKNTIDGEYCPSCGTKIELIKYKEQNPEVIGVAKTIEDILTKLGKDKELARVSSNTWEVKEGSATIKVHYNPSTFFLVGDAFLCQLPKQHIGEVYEFMLRENANLKSMLFSVSAQDIILSSSTYDTDMTTESGEKMLKELFAKADYYDTLLIEKYNCIPKLIES